MSIVSLINGGRGFCTLICTYVLECICINVKIVPWLNILLAVSWVVRLPIFDAHVEELSRPR